MVTGRFLQGVGGGGLVPATLALVADLYPAERRGVPLGIVSAVQEIGSVLGPLFGALVLAVADWRAIFLINLAVGLVLAAAIRRWSPAVERARPSDRSGASTRPLRLDRAACSRSSPWSPACSSSSSPRQLMRDLTYGQLFIPITGDGRWLTPLGRDRDRRVRAARRAAAAPRAARCSTSAAGSRTVREADLVGARPAGAGAGRRDPGVRDRRPEGAGLLRPGALVPPRRRARRRRLRAAPAPGRPAPGAARRAAPYAGLGRRCWSASSSAPP